MKKIALLILLIMSVTISINYYANINIEINNSGFATITENKNHPSLLIKDRPSNS